MHKETKSHGNKKLPSLRNTAVHNRTYYIQSSKLWMNRVPFVWQEAGVMMCLSKTLEEMKKVEEIREKLKLADVDEKVFAIVDDIKKRDNLSYADEFRLYLRIWDATIQGESFSDIEAIEDIILDIKKYEYGEFEQIRDNEIEDKWCDG